MDERTQHDALVLYEEKILALVQKLEDINQSNSAISEIQAQLQDTTISSESTAQATPAPTVADDCTEEIPEPTPSLEFPIGLGIYEPPEHDNLYIIRDMTSGDSITLLSGQLTLTDRLGMQGGWVWRCDVTTNGWIFFVNLVSGDALGSYDGSKTFTAHPSAVKNREFMLRPRALGGYNLLVNDGGKLKGVAICRKKSTPRLVSVEPSKHAAPWEFIKVDATTLGCSSL